MKASLAKEILASYDDNDEVAFVVYDSEDACIISGRAITPLQRDAILESVQKEICSCIDEDLCETILEELKEREE